MTTNRENNQPQNNTNSAEKLLESSTNIVFIDTAVIDYQSLVAGIILGSEVVILDPNKDGLAQITDFLVGRKSKSVQSVHIVSHGGAGSLQLGSSNVNLSNLNSYTNQLQKWKNALTYKADILLYGCDVASGEGTNFVQQISQITGADVAASTDKTGSAALGGDWDLEFKSGKIEASLAFKSEVMEAYKSILPASFTGISYLQDFNSLATSGTLAWSNDSTIEGWYANRTIYQGNPGSNTAGALYSFGSTSTSSDRALGSVASTTTGTIYYGLRLTNNTGSPITKLIVSYTGEQWRNGGNATPQKLRFSYQAGATFTSFPTGTLTPVTSLDFTGPIANTTTQGSLNGNLATNRVLISSTIDLSATPIAQGQEIILRWEDLNDSGNDHGLAIDNLSVKVDNTIYVVSNINDSGTGSLRQAIFNANNDPGIETIVFDATGIFGDSIADTITLTTGELSITEGIIIQGTGADKLTISGNNTSRVFNSTAALSIDGLKITQGRATVGGGINSTNSITVTNSIISGNTATSTTGGGINSTSIVTVSNSTISGNTANTTGGGINSTSTVNLSNSTISGNTANIDGGGIRSTGGTISNSTITNNTADSDNNNTGNGGGIFSSGTFSISNSIIAGNFDRGNQAPDISGNNFNGNAYNLIGSLAGKSSGTLGTVTDIVNLNPGLEPLANNGGSTQTHALEYSSPAVNAGNPSYGGGLTTDQRGTGFDRIKQGRLDIGAFESSYVSNTAPTLNNTGNPALTAISEDVIISSNLGSLVSAIIASGASGNPITDPDAGSVEGIAVTNVDNTNGVWQYSTNGGSTWNDFTVSATSATLLRDTASDRIRFLPNPNFNGSANITFRAWDAFYEMASGTTGINPGTGGGRTAFSTDTETASITVNPVDDTTFLVTNTNDSGFGSLRQAILDANNDAGIETIVFDTSAGVFADAIPDTITLTSGELSITEEVIIQGIGAAKLTISGNNASRVFSATASLIINDLKIIGGNSNDNGGGIYSTSSVSISNSTISGNSALNDGGGIYTNSSISVSNSNISGNSAGEGSGYGGGIFSNSTVNVSNSTISGNSAISGGGIYGYGSISVINSTISGNTANIDGGGIYGYGSISISNSTISGNSVLNDGGYSYGGGIYGYSSVSVSNSTISGNSAGEGSGYGYGGGIFSNSSVSVSNSTIFGNSAGGYGYGGGINSDNVSISNSTISGNSASNDGGGIFSNGGTISHSTITNNTANPGKGGGIYNSGDGTFSISNSIIAGNFDTGNQAPDISGNNFNGNAYNLIGSIAGKSSGTLGTLTDIVNPNPGLEPLADNGGSTQTHALKFDSLAVNAGNPSYSGGLTNDQRGTGFNRIQKGRLDIGAFESDYDNAFPKVSFGAATYDTTEGSTPTNVTIAVTLDATPNTDVTVPIVINNSSTATSGDYTFSPATITFAAGTTVLTKQVTFTIKPDDLPENAETVVLNFGTLTGAVAGTITQTTLNIAANDSIAYAISTNTPILTEGNSGTQSVTFTVTRSGGIGVESTVDYAFSGTGTFGSDYNQVSVSVYNGGVVTNGENTSDGTLNFAVGENTKTITVNLLGDNRFEPDENIVLTLSNSNLIAPPQNSTITTNTAKVDIINDDNQPAIRISDVSVMEGNGGLLTNGNFEVSLSNASYQQILVNYSTNYDTTNFSDFDLFPGGGTLIFNPGETLKTINFGIRGDDESEANETFSVNLFGASNATITDSLGVATIINDDINELPNIKISDVSVTEGFTGMITNANFVVTLSHAIYQPVIVNYSMSDDTAKTADSDYNSSLGTIIFNPGETSKILSIGVMGDTKVELDERFFVNLYGASNALISDSRGVGTIINDD